MKSKHGIISRCWLLSGKVNTTVSNESWKPTKGIQKSKIVFCPEKMLKMSVCLWWYFSKNVPDCVQPQEGISILALSDGHGIFSLLQWHQNQWDPWRLKAVCLHVFGHLKRKRITSALSALKGKGWTNDCRDACNDMDVYRWAEMCRWRFSKVEPIPLNEWLIFIE